MTNLSSKLLKAPLVLLVVASAIASVYAVLKGIAGITWVTPIVLFILIILYFAGVLLGKDKSQTEKFINT